MIGRWFHNHQETNPKTKRTYISSFVQFDEAENEVHVQAMKELKGYGNRTPGPNAVPGLKGGGEGTRG